MPASDQELTPATARAACRFNPVSGIEERDREVMATTSATRWPVPVRNSDSIPSKVASAFLRSLEARRL